MSDDYAPELNNHEPGPCPSSMFHPNGTVIACSELAGHDGLHAAIVRNPSGTVHVARWNDQRAVIRRAD